MADSRFFHNVGPFSLGELAKIAQAEIVIPANSNYDDSYLITDVAALQDAEPGQITVLHNSKYKDSLQATKSNVCIIHPDHKAFAQEDQILLLSKSPYRAYGLIAAHFYPDSYSMAIDDAEIGENVEIAPGAVIGKGVKIGDGCKIGANVTITHALIGRNVIIAPGACIGQPGFGFHMDESGHISVPQLGRVIIEDGVEIGANTTIDRGSASDTVIGAGSRIDNLVQIAHNVKLGRGCVIVSQVGISGSTEIGDFTAIGGQAGLTGHLKIGRGVQIAAQSGVMRDVADGQTVGGSPAVPARQWHKQTITLERMAISGYKGSK